METYIAILLLVVPGFIAINIFEKLNYQKRRRDSFETTTKALIFSVFIIILNYLVFRFFDKSNMSAQNIRMLFTSTDFIIQYAIITILNSILVGYLWSIIGSVFYIIINKLRLLEGQTKINGFSVFESYYENNQEHLLRVEQGRKTRVGFLEKFSFDDGKISEISLIREHEAKEIVDKISLKEKFSYINGELTLTEYNIDDVRPNNHNKHKNAVRYLAAILISAIVLALELLFCFLF